MVGKCYFSQDQTLYSHRLSQAFIFYGTDLKPNDLPLPRKGIILIKCVCLLDIYFVALIFLSPNFSILGTEKMKSLYNIISEW